MDGFQDLPKQFKRVLSSKKFNAFDILVVVLGGSTLTKKTMKWQGEFYAHPTAKLPRILFGRERGDVRSDKGRTILENVERKTSIQIPRSEFEVR